MQRDIFSQPMFHPKCMTLLVPDLCSLSSGKAVTVNGMPVTLPKSYSGSGLVLENIGLFVSLSSQLGVTLLWDGGICVNYLYNITDHCL